MQCQATPAVLSDSGIDCLPDCCQLGEGSVFDPDVLEPTLEVVKVLLKKFGVAGNLLRWDVAPLVFFILIHDGDGDKGLHGSRVR
jgi:hypothetical protein